MLDELRDPSPPAPTVEAREVVTRRARSLRRRRQAAAVTGGLGALALVVVGVFALFADDDPAPVATEVLGVQESNPSVTTTTTESTAPTELPGEEVPTGEEPAPSFPPSPPPPPPPSAASIAGEVVVGPGFAITGCTLNGGPLALTGTTFALSGLAPGTVVDVVCQAESGTGAARAARTTLTLQPGTNSLTLTL